MRKLFALAGLALLFAPCAARAADDQVYKVGDGVSAPVPLERTDPEYTEATRSEGVQGTVVMSVIINAEGRVESPRLVKKLHPDLDKNAVDCLKFWRFKPAEKDGKPVKVQATIEVNFRL